ncbi:MAG: class I SAM-dependent methyltransferase [Deltaproteobacteria bacterium]|nr:class I SAM-dependent methyltransferase [Deltaproteobacteria bacterium]
MTKHAANPIGTANLKMAFGVEPSNRLFRLRLARYKSLAETVASYVNEHPGALRLLDIGLGSGRSLRFIEGEGADKNIDFSGLDLDPDRLSTVYSPKRWTLYKGDIEKGAPFKDSEFDIVICEQVLEHLVDPAAALREISRVLKKGGLAIIGVPTFPPPITYVRRLYVALTTALLNKKHSHVQTFSSFSILRLLKDNGSFSVLSCHGVRVISGGILSKLEDFEGWYRFNRRLGAALPVICTEVQITAIRK